MLGSTIDPFGAFTECPLRAQSGHPDFPRAVAQHNPASAHSKAAIGDLTFPANSCLFHARP